MNPMSDQVSLFGHGGGNSLQHTSVTPFHQDKKAQRQSRVLGSLDAGQRLLDLKQVLLEERQLLKDNIEATTTAFREKKEERQRLEEPEALHFGICTAMQELEMRIKDNKHKQELARIHQGLENLLSRVGKQDPNFLQRDEKATQKLESDTERLYQKAHNLAGDQERNTRYLNKIEMIEQGFKKGTTSMIAMNTPWRLAALDLFSKMLTCYSPHCRMCDTYTSVMFGNSTTGAMYNVRRHLLRNAQPDDVTFDFAYLCASR